MTLAGPVATSPKMISQTEGQDDPDARAKLALTSVGAVYVARTKAAIAPKTTAKPITIAAAMRRPSAVSLIPT